MTHPLNQDLHMIFKIMSINMKQIYQLKLLSKNILTTTRLNTQICNQVQAHPIIIITITIKTKLINHLIKNIRMIEKRSVKLNLITNNKSN